ncbi:MAG TPA: HAMP domain-containing histidine kinase [Flammeovirgaceae bacterium]|nr:HAMP domain-containing histidine kinase [Flammeovirgaceae bacterium]
MKLTLQKLERAVASGTRPQAELVATVKNLLGQLQVLSDIVTSFSEFAKMPLPRNERMDLVAVIREVESVFSGDEKIDLQLQLPDSPVYMTGDSKLMNRILANILINAGQSARPQQKRVHVRIGLEVKEDTHKVLLAISDDGSGIAAEVRERVFIPRFSTKKEGSGIGLAVARHGVEQMGGTIWFETEEGKGTTFYLQFPLLD